MKIIYSPETLLAILLLEKGKNNDKSLNQTRLYTILYNDKLKDESDKRSIMKEHYEAFIKCYSKDMLRFRFDFGKVGSRYEVNFTNEVEKENFYLLLLGDLVDFFKLPGIAKLGNRAFEDGLYDYIDNGKSAYLGALFAALVITIKHSYRLSLNFGNDLSKINIYRKNKSIEDMNKQERNTLKNIKEDFFSNPSCVIIPSGMVLNEEFVVTAKLEFINEPTDEDYEIDFLVKDVEKFDILIDEEE